jgi:predicted nuclease of predicted toxin-antitoxin system
MDDKPSLLQRARSTLAYLGACLLLIESSRALLSWLRSHRWSQKRGEMLVQSANPTSVAFLVDAENISSSQMEHIVEHALDEAKKLGEVNIKRVYGNCNLFNNNNNKWNDTCLRLELEQIHLTKPTPTKNTADIALAVDAIELAVEGKCNRFCIVTSDSDFTPLARRLRELKCQVLGVGEKKTPKTLTAACNRFVFTDQLVDAVSPSLPSPNALLPRKPASQPTPRTLTPTHSSNEPLDGNQSPASSPAPDAALAAQPVEKLSHTVITILTRAYNDAVHGKVGEWVLLSRLGLSLRQLYPDFKAADYAEDLSDLIRQYHTVFDFGKRANGHPEMRLKQ